ncbi:MULTISPECIES: hypothetical protein [unclassified Shewanella]|uniref:hypothetical protein n=1 Tax=Shewanella TaxID=22 RepID=UPI0021D8C741|nr:MULTISPECIES: hypothetical protein [unclassified Shewanella]MCU7962076.1 hypothetical protein [Shewanella sp. SW32]MCU7970008.1 hypothetical protein [Shewanella sp. SW29]MCU8013809.1 hypothetical protein [Shewanella sp. SM74]MCU8056200.1 hypothetical protein [Shewanella sp. SM35]MCU8065134.1 hypothetical protein [Shewanella sp. SM34]
MKFTQHFSAKIKDYLNTWSLDLLNCNGQFYVCQHTAGKANKMLLNGSKSLSTALSMIKTVTSEPFVSVVVEKQLDLPLPARARVSFVRPELTQCVIVGIQKDGYTLAVIREDLSLSNANVIDGLFTSTLADLRLFDVVQASICKKTIQFNE